MRNFRNYGPDFHSIYGTMTLKSTRTYGITGTNFSGKMARPRQKIGRDTPPQSRRESEVWCVSGFLISKRSAKDFLKHIYLALKVFEDVRTGVDPLGAGGGMAPPNSTILHGEI